MDEGIETTHITLEPEAALVAYKTFEQIGYRVPNANDLIPVPNDDGSLTLSANAMLPMLECIVTSSIATQLTLDQINKPKTHQKGWSPGMHEQSERINKWRNEMEYKLASLGSTALLLHDAIESSTKPEAIVIPMPSTEERKKMLANRWRTRLTSNSAG